MTDHIELHTTGDKMPLVGFGTWRITDAQGEETIYHAIKAGSEENYIIKAWSKFLYEINFRREPLTRSVQRQGIQVTAYSSFGPAGLDKFTAASQNVVPLFEQDTIVRIAKKHSRTPAQILLRWLIERSVAVIPKSINPDRMKTNHDVFSWSLDDEDHKDIGILDRHLHYRELELYRIDIPFYD